MPLSDYTELLEWLKPQRAPGCIVEVGALIGNGTRQLASAFPDKTVWAIDNFDIYTDETENANGTPVWKFYESETHGRSSYELFCENIKDCPNVCLYRGYSTDFSPPAEIFLAIIDGGHAPEVVRNDFEKLKHSKFIAFHDYRHDLPELTRMIDEITEEMEKYVLPGWCVIRN